MGQQIIQQPNGLYAIFSSVVDDFIVYDATPDELVNEFLERERHNIKQHVSRIVDALERGEKPYHQFTMNWEMAINVVREIHGDDAESLRLLGVTRELGGET